MNKFNGTIYNNKIIDFSRVKLPARFYIKVTPRISGTVLTNVNSPTPEKAITNLEVYQNGFKIISQPLAGYLASLYRIKKYKTDKPLTDYMSPGINDFALSLDFLSVFINDKTQSEIKLRFEVNPKELFYSRREANLKILEAFVIFEDHFINMPIEIKPKSTCSLLTEVVSRSIDNGVLRLIGAAQEAGVRKRLTYRLPGIKPGGYVFIFPIFPQVFRLLDSKTITSKMIDEITLKYKDCGTSYYTYYDMYYNFKKLTGSQIPISLWESFSSVIGFKIPEDSFPAEVEITTWTKNGEIEFQFAYATF